MPRFDTVSMDEARATTASPEQTKLVAEYLAYIEKLAPGKAGKLSWAGEIPPQKWMNFYTKVLAKYATEKGLRLTLKVEVASDTGVSAQKIEETKVALRELGLNDDIETT